MPFAQTSAHAQSSAPKALIVEKVNESQLVRLEGNTPPAAIAQNDRGRVSSDLRMDGLILVLRRSPEQQAAFDAFVESQYDATSSNYHHWLEPQEVGEKFGPAPADIATVCSWLSSHGLSVDGVSKDRMTIRFSGSAAQVEGTFHTVIHNLMVKGEPHISNMSDPQIPMALEPVVLGPKALHNFIPRPLHRTGSKVVLNQETGKWERVATGNATSLNPRPEMGFGCGTNCQIEDVAPYDFAAIYNVLPLWTAASPIDGTGQTIAIAGRSDVRASDVATFRSTFGLTGGAFNLIKNGTDPGFCTGTSGNCTLDDQIENALDVEWSGAVAKGATVDLVATQQTNTNDAIYDSAQYVIQNVSTLGARILNVSYGLCELFEGTSGNTAYNGLWQSAATQGIAVFVATGDSGSPSCDQGGDAAGTPYGAEFGLSVSGIASTPFNTAVGGTDLHWGAAAAPYWNATDNSTNGSTAKGYIPEVSWNDSCTNPLSLGYFQSWATQLRNNGYSATSPTDAESACNFVVTWYSTIAAHTSPAVDLSIYVDSIGGGGGASNCTSSDGSTAASCTGGYAKPSWQSGVTGIPNDNKRDIPDVSFFAGNGLLGSAYLICVSDSGTCVASATSTTEPSGEEIGGTSVASPAMAGVMALINQKAGSPQGNPNSELYVLAGKQTYAGCSAETVTASGSCSFNDINTGTIAMPCTAGALNCTVSHSGDAWGILSGFAAGTGYDEATGLGSLNVANVVNAWSAATGTATATVAVAATPSTINVDQTTSVTVTVTGASGTPTGTVTLTGGGYSAGAGTLASGSYTFTIPANSLSGGSYSLTAHYSGDPTYAMATGTVSVTVNKLTPTVTVVANPTTVTATVSSVNVSVAVTGAGPTPTGTIQLSGGGYTSALCTLAAGNCTVTVPSSSLSNGSDVLTATYSGDSNYVTATGSATVTVTVFTPTVTVTPSTSNLARSASLTVQIAVAGSNGTPTGSVQLGGGGFTSPVTTLVGGNATITIPGGNLSAGTDSLTVNYSGDTTYVSASGSATVTVTVPTPTVTVVPSVSSLFTNVPLTVTGSVTGMAGTPTGTVTLVGGGYSSGAVSLSSGNYSVTIPAGRLSAGSDTLTVTYGGDSNFTSASNSAVVTVTTFVLLTPTVTVTPASGSIDGGQTLNVTATVTGTGATPTGTVTLSGGGYSSSAQTLAAGTYIFAIPANSLSAGTDSLSVSYSGDGVYSTGSGSANVTVTASAFTLAATTPANISRGSSASSTITWSTTTNYSGTVTLSSCTLNSGAPANSAADTPTCSVSSAAIAMNGTGTATVTTNAATTAMLTRPAFPQRGIAIAGSGAILALTVFFGIPARRRSWRVMLGMFLLVMTLGSLAACGGGGGSSSGGGGGGGTSDPGTASGQYVFTVTGTGSPAVTPAPTKTFTVTVN
ncbi:MAG: Ig-like domain repeat protein [Terracidiphilus sp.]